MNQRESIAHFKSRVTELRASLTLAWSIVWYCIRYLGCMQIRYRQNTQNFCWISNLTCDRWVSGAGSTKGLITVPYFELVIFLRIQNLSVDSNGVMNAVQNSNRNRFWVPVLDFVKAIELFIKLNPGICQCGIRSNWAGTHHGESWIGMWEPLDRENLI